MIALDTNIIVGAMVASHPLHQPITQKIKTLKDNFCTTPTNVGEVFRLLTHPKVFQSPIKITPATQAFSDFIQSHHIRLLDESTEWWKELPKIEKTNPGLKGNEVFDARIAICLKQHNVKQILTQDTDFKKYDFLQTIFIE